ncbi:extracellular solute-binding protein [Rubrimonas cliftonensis]|uniref:Spermidine/putrescine transport system substrate-binding protein n=1 Tax=Rubrimonas cliftonensis TaxID=89524 RepID=A0A1H4CMM8_9RHOB|nr:extracellular solute-binding protein [Rubrimonas cliftonensis]SEA61579.1 spermidine/putrescine transport system substrate-binding protein [Rubrimonas cliftonensis]
MRRAPPSWPRRPAARVSTQELNALVWRDHTDDAPIRPFEEAHGVTVNLKEYEGAGAALSIIEQSRPGDWDVLVIDGVDAPRAVAVGILAPLPVDEPPHGALFPEPVMAANHVVDGETCAISEKLGYNTVSFNSSAVSAEALADMRGFWTGGASAPMAVHDHCLPAMGLVAAGLGAPTAELAADDLPAIREALFGLKDASESVGGVVASQTAIATGEADVLFGGGEWVTAGLTGELPELDWTTPEQGAVRWSQSIGVFADS